MARAPRAHDRTIESLRTQWTEGGTRLQPRYVPKGEASALVRVPSFGKGYVVPVLSRTSITTGSADGVRALSSNAVGVTAVTVTVMIAVARLPSESVTW